MHFLLSIPNTLQISDTCLCFQMPTNKITIERAMQIIQEGSGLEENEMKKLTIEDFISLLDLVREKNRAAQDVERKIRSIKMK